MFLSCYIFFFKQKTACELRISDWSSDVCSSDLDQLGIHHDPRDPAIAVSKGMNLADQRHHIDRAMQRVAERLAEVITALQCPFDEVRGDKERHPRLVGLRSEEHTSELQSLMRISYAVFCLKKKQTQ